MYRYHGRVLATVAVVTTLATALPAQAGSWVTTAPPVHPSGNSTTINVTPTSGSNYVATATAVESSMVGALMAFGVSTPAVPNLQDVNVYSGTWTFTWQPSSGTDWPSSFTVTEILSQLCSGAITNAGATLSATAGLASINFTWPGSPATVNPTATTTKTTSNPDPNLAITTVTSTTSSSQPAASGWAQSSSVTKQITNAYAAAYFPAHFSTPSAVVLTFTASLPTSQANLSSYSSTSSSGNASVFMSSSDFFSGQ